jgi:hypothetical protein
MIWQKKINFFTKLGETACFCLPDAEKNMGDKSSGLNYYIFV